MIENRTFYLYTSPQCNFCDKAKQLLEKKGLKFIVMELSREHDTLIRLKEEMEWNTVPMVFEMEGRDKKFIGGYTDLLEYLEDKNE